jgi:hypothetical protein
MSFEYTEKQLIGAIAGSFALIFIFTYFISRKGPDLSKLERLIERGISNHLAAQNFRSAYRHQLTVKVKNCTINIEASSKNTCSTPEQYSGSQIYIDLSQVSKLHSQTGGVKVKKQAYLTFEFLKKLPGYSGKSMFPDGFVYSFSKTNYCNGKSTVYSSSSGKSIVMFMNSQDNAALTALFGNIYKYKNSCKPGR